VLWYRKSFTLPAEWSGSIVWLDFEGSFRSTTVWVNGEPAAYHDCGYTPFRLRLDNITNVKFGGANVIAVFVDPDNGDQGGREKGSGWWYEGGGLYRHVKLVQASPVHVAQDGFFASSNLSASLFGGPSANMRAAAEVTNAGGAAAQVCVRFSLVAPDGSQAAMATTGLVDVLAGGSATAVASFSAGSVQLWTSSQPVVYIMHASVHLGQCSGSPVDSVEQPHGFRSLRYDANDGFFLNGQHFKVRGFCDHNTFAVVGMAVPPTRQPLSCSGVQGRGRQWTPHFAQPARDFDVGYLRQARHRGDG
jgi:beta-galactosidase/beta-glucuronidase